MGGVYALYEERLKGVAGLVSSGKSLSDFKRGLAEELVRVDSETLRERLERVRRHYEELREALKSMKAPYLCFEAEAVEPLLVGSTGGLGYMAFEVGLAWDPVYDVPVIPGSAVKGVARAALEDIYGRRVAEEVVGDVFGATGGEGRVGPLMFFDAYPVEARGGLLAVDVVNPHYKDARSELDVRPVPVVHLVVRRGTKFCFLVALDRRFDGGRVDRAVSRLSMGDGSRLTAYLLGAVMGMGVGGRTLRGYGRLKLVGEKVDYYGGE